MDQALNVTVGGQVLGLGLLIPEKIPLSFAEYPAEKLHDLPDLKKIYSANGRKHNRDLASAVKTKQQGRASSCCPYAATTNMEFKRAFDHKDHVTFQPEWLYSKINGGCDAGAMLDDAMKELIKNGCCLEFPKLYQDHTLSDLSMEEKRFLAQQAMMNRVLDYYTAPIQNLEKCWHTCVSAIANRDPVLLAVHCDDGFFACGPDGRCRVDKGPGNHATCGYELENVLQAGSIRDIKIRCRNSHGGKFGDKGDYLHTYDHMAGPCQYHQHCPTRSVRTSEEETISTLLA